MPDGSLSLREGVAVLKKHYGPPAPLPTADPFELILCGKTWPTLHPLGAGMRPSSCSRSTIGTRPAAILAAKPKTLEHVTSLGILKSTLCRRRLPHCEVCPLGAGAPMRAAGSGACAEAG